MKTLAYFKDAIDRAIEIDGPYSHNIISIMLRETAKSFGIGAANQMIEEFNLEPRGWVKETCDKKDSGYAKHDKL